MRRLPLPLLLLLPLLAACTTSWSLRAVRPESPLQWPFEPALARVTYLEALTGLEGRGSGAARLRDAVVGAPGGDPDAFVLPVAVATAPDGRIAVADMGRRCVHLYIPLEKRYLRLTSSGDEAIVSPVGVAFGQGERLFVADSSGKLLTFGRDGAPLAAVHALGATPLQRPTGLAFSPRRDLLYLVDTLAHEVHAIRGDGEVAFSFGGRGEGAGRFNFPTHVTWSPRGELYVTDALNFRVQIFDEEGHHRGQLGHHGNGSGDLAMPKGVAVDADGVVYVVDGIFDNVQLFDREGAFLLTLGGRGRGLGEFWLPSGAHISESGELFVCDTYNRRVQRFRIARSPAGGDHAAS